MFAMCEKAFQMLGTHLIGVKVVVVKPVAERCNRSNFYANRCSCITVLLKPMPYEHLFFSTLGLKEMTGNYAEPMLCYSLCAQHIITLL